MRGCAGSSRDPVWIAVPASASLPVFGGQLREQTREAFSPSRLLAVWYRAPLGALRVAAYSVAGRGPAPSVRPDESRPRTVMVLCRRDYARLASKEVKPLVFLNNLAAKTTVNGGLT
jgi:hypothetical protein